MENRSGTEAGFFGEAPPLILQHALPSFVLPKPRAQTPQFGLVRPYTSMRNRRLDQCMQKLAPDAPQGLHSCACSTGKWVSADECREVQDKPFLTRRASFKMHATSSQARLVCMSCFGMPLRVDTSFKTGMNLLVRESGIRVCGVHVSLAIFRPLGLFMLVLFGQAVYGWSTARGHAKQIMQQ